VRGSRNARQHSVRHVRTSNAVWERTSGGSTIVRRTL
jgi:hypothetical protein